MRNVVNISAVLACGLLAGICGLVQGQPSRAASVSGSAIAVASQLRPVDPLIMPVRKSASVEAHFAAANTTHDGRLTELQAVQGDWPRVAKHFNEIDVDHNGWISLDQIHQFNKAHARHRKDLAVG